MSVITFWNDSREQSGKTLTAVAIATNMAIERNSKVLLLSTSFDDPTMKNCFWGSGSSRNTGMFSAKNNAVTVENGIEGLFKLVASNKLTPSEITDYTKVVFRDRLEVIGGFAAIKGKSMEENIEQYNRIQECYVELIKTANQYYDIVIVDLDKTLLTRTKEAILKISDVNVYVLSQRLESIDRYNELRNMNKHLLGNRHVPVIGRYDDRYKYNSKNVARYLGERKELDLLPFNLLYMEATEETKVADLLLRLKNVKDKTDENYIFMQCVQNLTNKIVKKMQEMQMKLR